MGREMGALVVRLSRSNIAVVNRRLKRKFENWPDYYHTGLPRLIGPSIKREAYLDQKWYSEGELNSSFRSESAMSYPIDDRSTKESGAALLRILNNGFHRKVPAAKQSLVVNYRIRGYSGTSPLFHLGHQR
jgi:hypothetical protein